MAELSPLFTWRGAVASAHSGLSPTTRHVALTLSLHMSEKGDSCFPSVDLLADETGLHYDTVREHLRNLAAAGWIERDVRRLGAGKGTRIYYTARIPVTETGVQDPGVGVHTGVLGRATPGPCTVSHRGATPLSREGVIEDVSESVTSLTVRADPSLPFEPWWSGVWRKVGRAESEKLWNRMSPAEQAAATAAAPLHAEAWRKEGRERGKLIHPATWLRNRRWEDELDTEWRAEIPRRQTPGMGAIERRRIAAEQREKVIELPTGRNHERGEGDGLGREAGGSDHRVERRGD